MLPGGCPQTSPLCTPVPPLAERIMCGLHLQVNLERPHAPAARPGACASQLRGLRLLPVLLRATAASEAASKKGELHNSRRKQQSVKSFLLCQAHRSSPDERRRQTGFYLLDTPNTPGYVLSCSLCSELFARECPSRLGASHLATCKPSCNGL